MTDMGAIWWSRIPGPSAFVEAAANALRCDQCVVLALPSLTPWIDSMRICIEERLRGTELIREDLPTLDATQQPGDVLLARFAEPSVRNGYRASGGETTAQYLLRQNVLHQRLLWGRELDSRDAKSWLAFVRQHKTCGWDHGLFLLEVPGDMALTRMPQHVALLRYEAFLGDYDMPLFCSGLVSDHAGSANAKAYMSTLACMLCGDDAMLAEAFLERMHDVRADPAEVMARVYDDCCGGPPPDEVARDVPRRIWQAQIKALYALLEDQRMSFVERWHAEIAQALALAGDHAKQFGERVDDPYDAEWGLLYHLAHQRMSDGNRMLYIPDEDAFVQLCLCRLYRNKLSHRDALGPEEVQVLLK